MRSAEIEPRAGRARARRATLDEHSRHVPGGCDSKLLPASRRRRALLSAADSWPICRRWAPGTPLGRAVKTNLAPLCLRGARGWLAEDAWATFADARRSRSEESDADDDPDQTSRADETLRGPLARGGPAAMLLANSRHLPCSVSFLVRLRAAGGTRESRRRVLVSMTPRSTSQVALGTVLRPAHGRLAEADQRSALQCAMRQRLPPERSRALPIVAMRKRARSLSLAQSRARRRLGGVLALASPVRPNVRTQSRGARVTVALGTKAEIRRPGDSSRHSAGRCRQAAGRLLIGVALARTTASM
jgi:hypothetical protein